MTAPTVSSDTVRAYALSNRMVLSRVLSLGVVLTMSMVGLTFTQPAAADQQRSDLEVAQEATSNQTATAAAPTGNDESQGFTALPSPLPTATATSAPTQVTTKPETASETPNNPNLVKPTDQGLTMGAAGKNLLLNEQDLTAAQLRSDAQVGSPLMASALSSQPGGTASMQLGMDVSGWQGTVNWSQAWASGARFAYVKASEGAWTLNDYFAQQYNGSAKEGMIRGAYHFARPNVSTGTNQAQVFIESGGSWSDDGMTLPGVLDLEAHASTGPADTVGKCYNMTAAQLLAWTKDFLTTYKGATTRDAVIYTSHDFWLTCMGNTTAVSTGTPLWIAAYGPSLPNLLIPGGWPRFTFWQYADSGTFVGDQNVFNGSLQQLKTFARGSQPVTPALSKDVVSGHDFNGDRKTDVITTKSDGTLWFYAGSGSGAVGAGRKIGSGWEVFDQVMSVGDFNGDAKSDLMARNRDGSLWFYAGTGVVGNTSEGYRAGVKVGAFGWNSFTQILGVGDFNQDGKGDLLAKGKDGSLWLKPGLGNGQVSGGQQIGSGWNVFDLLVAPGDYDLDKRADVVARKSDGSLWFYAGTGIVAASKEGYKAGVKIGEFGWSDFSQIVGTGDANGDGKNDLLARRSEGSLWFYPGTGMKDNGYSSATKVGSI